MDTLPLAPDASRLCGKRRSRLRRKPSGKRLELTERDFAVFRLLSRYRFLRSTQLHAFVGGKSQKRFVERLGHLYHEGGYLNRPAQQWQTVNARYMPVVYELADAGYRVLIENGGAAEGSLRRPQIVRQYRHELMICEIMASIELAVSRDRNLRFVSWAEIHASPKMPAETRLAANPLAVPVAANYTSLKSKELYRYDRPLIPDAVFGIEYLTNEQKQYRFFALEADRNTEPLSRSNLEQSSYLRKLLQYREIATGAIYRSWWGLPNLLVLNVTTNGQHLQNLMRLAAELTEEKGSSYLLFKMMPLPAAFESASTPTTDILTAWERVGHCPFDLSAMGL